ncbi:MAG: STAS domain-containing protein [Tenuifilaceae bacterium]|jgi:anti-sigma B factor antagonist|uniref:STAS domain-containing protein n=1 Tax=Perlabentimonas gracilis TaxID=2715279 RepID=UPI00140E1C76|nr:STAS domain-containing protein [Perlabentimonas gracilis]MDX9770472.1 STAS domain-containing protein [Tenuifilaceae bacterium]NHB67285.1 STAS domain-containing protein [Perlabentimonas gracilis]
MINVEKINDVLVVSIANENKLNAAISQNFKIEVAKLFDQPSMKMVIDLGGIEYIDSSGFGSLLSVLRSSKGSNAQLKLCNIAPEVMALVHLLQLQTVFDIRTNMDECLNSFK